MRDPETLFRFVRPSAGLVSFALVTLLVSGCATSRLPPVSAAGPSFEPVDDERALWQEARAEERMLLDEARLYDDPLLADYLERVVHRLNPPAMAANPEITYRVTVIDDPSVNAFAYPHGSLFVHTGLLARMETEGELATVLAHEMSHVEGRHMIRYRRAARNRQIGWTVAAVTAAVVLGAEEAEAYSDGHWGRAASLRVVSDWFVGLGLQLAVIASINGYGRELEAEADGDGFAKLVAAGYDPDAAPAVYETLLEDRGPGDGGPAAFFFASHPRLADRLESARAWAADRPGADGRLGGVDPGDPGEMIRYLTPVVRDDVRANLDLDRLGLAENGVERLLAWRPGDPETHLLLGRLRLAQAETAPDAAAARALEAEAEVALREAVRLAPQWPEPHLELALLAYRRGDDRAACRAFRHYLDADPGTPHRGTVPEALLALERAGRCR